MTKSRLLAVMALTLIFTLNGCSSGESKSTVEPKSIRLDSEDIVLTFEDEFEVLDGLIKFGPKVLIPESPTDKTYEEFYYRLELTDKRNADEIRQEVAEKDQRSVSLEPTEIEIGSLEGLKWAVGGMCEERIMELFGNENNLKFYSGGCHTLNKEMDFEYFESLFK